MPRLSEEYRFGARRVVTLQAGVIEIHGIQHDGAGARKKTGHEVPGIAALNLVAAAPEIRAQQHGGKIGKLCEHEFHHRAGIQIWSVVLKESDVARHHAAQVVVTHGLRGELARLEILRDDGEVAAFGDIPDGLAEHGVAEDVFGAEEFAGEVNAEWFFGHEAGRSR